MSKIIPTIFNGKLELVLSETFIASPSRGIEVYIPLKIGKNAIFKFIFVAENESNSGVQISQQDDGLTFVLKNFLTSLGTALLNPFEFNVGNELFGMQIFATKVAEDVAQFTISIFRIKNGRL